MLTRLVTFLPDGDASAPSARRYEFETSQLDAPTRNHLAVLARRLVAPFSLLALGSPAARQRAQSEGRLAEGWLDAPALGYREVLTGMNEAERWASFTAVANSLEDTPLRCERLDGEGLLSEPEVPSGIVLDLTHASGEQTFLAASVVSFLQLQRRRNQGVPLNLRVVAAGVTGPDQRTPLIELTSFLNVLSWDSNVNLPRTGLTPPEPPPRERMNTWVRRAKTLPAVPWAASATPRALNLTGRPLGPIEAQAAAAQGLVPVDFPGTSLHLDPSAPRSEVDALADRVAARLLDEQPTAVLLDAEPTIALALVARLQRASVRCFARLDRGDQFAAWREFPSLGL